MAYSFEKLFNKHFKEYNKLFLVSPFKLIKSLHVPVVILHQVFLVFLVIQQEVHRFGNICMSSDVLWVYPCRYTHKTSGFKTSGFTTSGFKTSETSGLQNVRFTKRQVYKMPGLQNVRSSKRPVAKKHPYIFCTCGWWQFLYFLLNKYIKFKNGTFWTQTFWNPTFCKPDVL